MKCCQDCAHFDWTHKNSWGEYYCKDRWRFTRKLNEACYCLKELSEEEKKKTDREEEIPADDYY